MVIALRQEMMMMMMMKFLLGLSLAVNNNNNKCSLTAFASCAREWLALAAGHSFLAYYDICDMYKWRMSFVCLCWFLVFGGD